MSEKSQKLMEQLEDEGLENTHRTLAIHHQVLMDLVGGKSKIQVPKREKREEPKKTSQFDPTTMRHSPPSAGERVSAKDSRVAVDERLESAANTVSGDPAEEVAKEKAKIAADDKLAKDHGVKKGATHPEDKGEDDPRIADVVNTDGPTIPKRSAKKGKKAR